MSKCDHLVSTSVSFKNLGLLKPDKGKEKDRFSRYFDFCPDCGEKLRNKSIKFGKSKRDETAFSHLERDVWAWFGLTYASYLVIPRVWLQSMPDTWQLPFVRYLEQIPETLEIDESYEASYSVNYRVNGKFTKDPYRSYRHSSVPLKR